MNTTIRIILVFGLSALSVLPLNAQLNGKPTISVTGSADIKVKPDEVQIKVGVETRHETLDGAKRQNDERISKALIFLKQNGVKDQDIQTDYVIVEPTYDEQPNVSLTTGLPLGSVDERRVVQPLFYVVRKSIGIKLIQVSAFDKILSGLITNGVNHVHRVDFRTSALRKLKDEARTMAVRSAKEKAQGVAMELGVKVGKPLYINADDWSGWSGWSAPGKWSYGSGGGMGGIGRNGAQNPGDEAAATFAVGEISITANVRVSFLIE